MSSGSGKEFRDFHLLCEKFDMCVESHEVKVQITPHESLGGSECWVPETKALSYNCISGEEGASSFTTSIKEQLLLLAVLFSQEVQYIVRAEK